VKLRNKTLLIIGATIITLTLLLTVLARTILLDEFDDLQAEAAQQNLRQALKSLQNQIAQVDTALGDWAPWDDSYRFVQGGNQTYIDSNLVPDTFTNLRLNLIVFVDKSGQVIYAKAFDLVNEAYIPLPEGLSEQIAPGSFLLDYTDIESRLNGILILPEVPVLIASHPILQSNHAGTMQGSLIFGRYLDEAAIQYLSNEVELKLDAEPFNNPNGEDFVRASQALTEVSSTVVYPLDSQTTAGYALLPDIYGQPGLVMRVETPNKISRQGQTSFAFFIAALLVCGLAVGVAIAWLLEKYVLSRLTALEKRLGDIHISGRFDKRVDEQGNDELSALAHSANLLLESIEKSHHTLQNLNRELETSLSELRLAQEQKDRFFTHAGHEFRTPLANLRTRLYLTRKKPDLVQEHLPVLERATEQMTALVEDVFDVARYSKRNLELDERNIRIQEIIQAVINEQIPKAAARQVNFTPQVVEGDAYVYADAGKLKQALSNVFTYAIAFTPSEASITSYVSTFADEVMLQITSDNIDIKPESASQIFQPFFRASEGGNSSTGLSLTLAKEIIELHFGRITYESNGPGGGTFTIKLLLVDEANRKDPSTPTVKGHYPAPDAARQTVQPGQVGTLPGG